MLNLINDTISRSSNSCRRQHGYFCSHKVGSGYRTQSDSIIIGTLVAHNANTAHIGQSCKVLARTLAHRQLVYLFTINCICILYDSNLFRSYIADDADCQTRTRERLTCYQVFRQAQLTTGLTNLVLEQITQRLNDFLEINKVRQTANIMMALNSCRFAAEAAFYNVRINGSLCQIVNSTDFLSFFFKYANEFFADNFTFSFRSSYACQLAIEAFACVNADEVDIELTAFTENSANLFTLVFAQQTMIYKYAGQLLADSLSQHSGTNAGVNTA